MDEHFQPQTRWTGGPHDPHFVDIQLARQNHLINAQSIPRPREGRRKTDVGQGGQMDFTLESRPARQRNQTQILDDKGVGPDSVYQGLDPSGGLVQVPGRQQGIQGDIDPHTAPVGQGGQDRQFGQGEILGRHARGQVLQAAVDRVGTGGQSR